MPNNWKTYKLGELGDIKGGKRLPKGEALVTTKTKHPYIRVTDMGTRTIPIEKLQYVPNDVFPKISRYIVNKNDLILSIVGTVGSVSIIDEKLDNASLTENCVKITNLKNIDSEYLYYFLISDIGQFEIVKGIVGSTQPKLPIYNINNLDISLPSLQEQKSIASILSAIDDKIENNLAINKTLEEMAMAIYKHWFVDFGPFQEGEFVESELGRIPKGWEVRKIGEVIETLGGGTPSTTIKEYWEDGDILWYSPTDLTRENSLFSFDTAKKITALGLQKSSAKMFPANSLLMSSRATIGLLTINTKEACTNQGFITMLPNDKLTVYQLYFWLKDNMDLIVSKANGSTFKEISKSNFRDLEIVVPNSIESYIEQTKDIFEQIKNNTSENQTLTQLRDTLLPKLISGEVRLKEFRESITN